MENINFVKCYDSGVVDVMVFDEVMRIVYFVFQGNVLLRFYFLLLCVK